MYCDLYCFGLTIYIMHFYWVSLGWFYPLDILCDLSFISPLCGVAQTPDCGIVILFTTFWGVFSDTRSVHSIFTPVLHTHVLIARVHHRFSFTSWQAYRHKWFRSMIISYYIIPVFGMFASTFKRTHWLVPGYCLGQISRMEISIAVTVPEPRQCG